MQELSLGYSPCPNDTYIFYALTHDKLGRHGLRFRERLEDVETLNQLALEGVLDVTKISCHALCFLRDQYWVLRSGGALGRGCGPLLVARDLQHVSELKGKRVALPGPYTTAALLFRLLRCDFGEEIFLPFHEIMNAVKNGEVDAGVIIHESRFTYHSYGLKMLMDLGEWWEQETGHPIPLGCIVARRSLGASVVRAVEGIVKDSIAYAGAHLEEVKRYVRRHSQEMSEEVCAAHIALYVNNYSFDLGRDGQTAIDVLLRRAEAIGLVPTSKNTWLIK